MIYSGLNLKLFGFNKYQVLLLVGIISFALYVSINNVALTPGAYMFNWFNDTNKLETSYAVESTEFPSPEPLSSFYQNGEGPVPYSNDNNEISDTNGQLKLRDFFICASYHTPILSKMALTNSYVVSPQCITGSLKRGARFLHMDVMGDSFSPLASPVVGVCRELGNELVSVNTIPFEKACDAVLLAIEGGIGCSAIKGDNYTRDPILLYFRTKFENRNDLEKKMANIILEKFDRYLLPSGSYSYTNFQVNNQPIQKLFGKIIIVLDRAPKTPELTDITNAVMCGKNLNEFKKPRRNIDENERIDCGFNGTAEYMRAINNSQYDNDLVRELLPISSTGNPNILAVFPDDLRLNNMTSERIKFLQGEGVNIIPLFCHKWNRQINADYLNSRIPGAKNHDDMAEPAFKYCGYLLKNNTNNTESNGSTLKLRYIVGNVTQPNEQDRTLTTTENQNNDNDLGVTTFI